MKQMSGTVAAVRKDRKGLCINDVWYSVYAVSQMKGVEKGASVSFDYITNEKGYNNIKGDVKVEEGGSSPAPQAASGSVQGVHVVTMKDRQIIRQNSMGNAVRYAATFMVENGASPEDVVAVARVFEAYCTGESDVSKQQDDDLPFGN